MAGTEILDISGLNAAGYGPIRVYVNVGYEPYPSNFNPLPDSKFDSYLPDPGFVLNTGLRTPLFSGVFNSSPLLDDGEYDYITDSQGYTAISPGGLLGRPHPLLCRHCCTATPRRFAAYCER